MSHENFARAKELKTATNRSFGLVVGGILAAIGGLRAYLHAGPGVVEIVLWSIGVALIVLALVAPGWLTPFNRAWTLLGYALSKVVTPIIMGLVFFTTVTPTGLIARLMGKDLLKTKLEPSADTYWVERKPPGPAPETMKNQF